MSQEGVQVLPPVLVLAGPGLGHYQPICDLLCSVVLPGPGEAASSVGRRVVVVVELRPDDPLVERIGRDGYEVRLLDVPNRLLDRLMRRLAQRVERDLARRLAMLGSIGADLPPLHARLTFAFAARIKPLRNHRSGFLHAVRDVIDDVRPSLVMSDLYFGDSVGRITKSRCIPWVEYATGLVPTPSSRLPVGPGLGGNPGRAERAVSVPLAIGDWIRSRYAYLASRRAIPLSVGESRPWPDLRIAFSSDDLDPPYDLPGAPGWSHVGIIRPQRPIESSSRRGDRLVFVTMGSSPIASNGGMPSQLLEALDGLAADGVQVVIQSQNVGVRRWVSGRPKQRIQIVDPTDGPPFEWYRQADLIVGHGGWGTIREAIACGVPILVMPFLRADRMDTSRRVIDAGVGAARSPYTADSQNIRNLIEAMLEDDGLKRRVERMAPALWMREQDATLLQLKGLLKA